MNLEKSPLLKALVLSILFSGCEKEDAPLNNRESDPHLNTAQISTYESSLTQAQERQKASEPNYRVKIELPALQLVQTIPELRPSLDKFSETGGVLHGNIVVVLEFPDGGLIERRCSMVTVDYDAKGISRIGLNAYERLNPEKVETQIEGEWMLFKAVGMPKDDFAKQRKKVGIWLGKDDDGRSSKEAIYYDGEKCRAMVTFSQLFDRNLGVGIRYEIRPKRIGETKWEREFER